MATSVFRPGATALITGAASGIGFAVAQLCRSHGMHLALVDINSSNLSKALSTFQSGGKQDTKTETYTMDVSQLSEWQKLKSDVEQKFPNGVDLLMLNAGAGFQPKEKGKPWDDPDYFSRVRCPSPICVSPPPLNNTNHRPSPQTFATNIFGPINGLSTFLPALSSSTTTSTPKSIIITGSKQGITNPPGGGNPAYNASKATLKHLAEHLSHDLRSTPHTAHISVHLLIPGWTYTSFSGNAGPVPDSEAEKNKPKGAWLASQVAEYMYKKMNEGQFYIVCPDNDVSEALDQARMTWAMGDVTEGRSALSRWDGRFKDEAAEWISGEAKRREGKM